MQGHNLTLLWESYETRKYITWTEYKIVNVELFGAYINHQDLNG